MQARDQRRVRRDEVARHTAERTAAGRNAPGRVRWRRWRRRAGEVLLRLCGPPLLRLLACTWRVRRCGDAGFAQLRGQGPWLVATWHGRMLCLMPLRWHARRGLDVLVSPSDDGGLAAIALARFGYRVIRGSMSRGGARALRTMTGALQAGSRLVVTPDGPRGPRHTVNSGLVWLARATGAPVLPLGVAVDRAWRLRSWDRCTIPKPFARLVVFHGEPIVVAADADDAELERTGARVRTALLAGERAAFAELGSADDLDGAAP
ncbi:MAG: lysophospholipid acyltransferase family protein [Planctomycetes bacterium]|nr:lysophospholipid acyltransferase family protein [Planctomycetota bacterium]